MTTPDTATFAAFARLARFKQSYVTQLRRDGRLVLTEDGKAVRVAESLARIQETRDPSKAGVAERHAEARGAPTAGAPPPDARDEDAEEDAPGGDYQGARARREHWLAMAAQRDYETSIGKLLDASQVAAQVQDVITQLRLRLEALPDILGPQLAAEADEGRCRSLIAEEIDQALADLARKFGALGTAPGATA